jgi:hypothetical protein
LLKFIQKIKVMKHFLSILTVLLLVSCAPIYVNYDYEEATDFSKYKTYQYFGDMETGLSQLDTKRLLECTARDYWCWCRRRRW